MYTSASMRTYVRILPDYASLSMHIIMAEGKIVLLKRDSIFGFTLINIVDLHFIH